MARRENLIDEADVNDDDDSDVSINSSKGFDSESSTSKSDTIYSMPPLYDLAFGYRSYEDEVDFLLFAYNEYNTCAGGDVKPIRILELAAGPARHSLAALTEFSSSEVESVVALDRSPDMVNYGIQNADHELGVGGGRRDTFTYVCGDMRKIREATKVDVSTMFDTVWLLLGSMQHLLTNDDIIACLLSIYSVLQPGGKSCTFSTVSYASLLFLNALFILLFKVSWLLNCLTHEKRFQWENAQGTVGLCHWLTS